MYKLKMFKKLAKIKYLPNNFEVIQDGDHVICAISGKKIPLEKLNYWNVEEQEAYYSYIEDSGSGSLLIRGSDLILEDAGGNDYITCNDTGTGGTVTLKHNASTVFATASGGVSLTGGADANITDGTQSGATITFDFALSLIRLIIFV